MRGRQSPVESLVTLPRVSDSMERRARWRQAITALGQDVRVEGPPKTDGASPEDLALAARIAVDTGLIDEMDWIDAGAAAVALYELSAALPPGKERREVGRRVFERLYQGTAGTFAAVATRMALGAGRPLEAATLRARVGLLFALPIGSSVNSDPLALTLLMRRDLFERWVARGATGPLPSRRLSATLIERASREAVRRYQQGDPRPADLFTNGPVHSTFEVLLADREPLVWRHAAVARGLLSAVIPRFRQEIDLALDPGLSPTEWRRAAVSLVPCFIHDFDTAFSQCRSLIDGEIAQKDPGLTATLIWGLPPVIEAEPEAAETLLERLSFLDRHDVADAMASLLSDVLNPEYGTEAAERVRALVMESVSGADPTMQAIFEDTLRGLDRRTIASGVCGAIRRALIAYETQGARAAHEMALEAMERAHATMDAIETLSEHDEHSLAEVLGPLADLDASTLERSSLYDLLLLGKRPGDATASVPDMERLYERLGKWVLDSEERYVETEFSRGETIARQRKLRALLHLVDMETSGRTDDENIQSRVRMRVRRTVRVLLRIVASGPDASVHRILCASLARSLDAAVREGVADPADLLLLLFEHLTDSYSMQAMTEASTNLEVQTSLRAYAQFLAMSSREAMESIIGGTFDAQEYAQGGPRGDELRTAQTFIRLSEGIGTNGSYRGEALRQVILRIGRALESIATARGLSELVETASSSASAISELEQQVDSLKRLIRSVSRRVLDRAARPPTIEVVADVPPLSALIERAVTGVPANQAQLAMSIGELTAELPAPITAAISTVLAKVPFLPPAPPSDVSAIPLQTRRSELPDWLLPRRTIGGFYVVRALGSGGVSSVFVARRIEERHSANAELYALKVPYYDPNTARSLSEQEFMQMFRDEAGALLSLPQHANLARFVTFDLAAKPKPILVMELIRGFSLDRLIRNRSITMTQVLRYLDGILAGLHAMHSAGVGHLDVKPSNVILRDEHTPVLVDFGLSGRQLRPGCGTLEYCAPEIIGVGPKDYTPPASGADMYAYACTAFELLTGELLFDAEDEMDVMHQHVQHDGWPDRLAYLAATPEYANMCVVLAACLRREPRSRPSAAETRRALADATKWLHNARWPLASEEPAGLTAS